MPTTHSLFLKKNQNILQEKKLNMLFIFTCGHMLFLQLISEGLDRRMMNPALKEFSRIITNVWQSRRESYQNNSCWYYTYIVVLLSLLRTKKKIFVSGAKWKWSFDPLLRLNLSCWKISFFWIKKYALSIKSASTKVLSI